MKKMLLFCKMLILNVVQVSIQSYIEQGMQLEEQLKKLIRSSYDPNIVTSLQVSVNQIEQLIPKLNEALGALKEQPPPTQNI